MDRQDAFGCMRVFGTVHHEFAVSHQIRPQEEGETVLKCFKAWARLLLPRDVCAFRHLLPLQARFIHVEYLLGLIHPLLDDGLKTIWVGSSGILVGALGLSRALDAMEAIARLKLIKSACAGNEIGHRAGLLLLQVVEALHRLVLGVVKGHIKTLVLPMVHPCDQHLLHPDHDVGLA